MNNADIEKLALANGFKLKEQPDGEMALNPYVFDFAKALLNGQYRSLGAKRTHLLQAEFSRFQMEMGNIFTMSAASIAALNQPQGK